MEAKLSNKQIIRLINLYRSHPILWDMNHKSYRRNDIKKKSYEAIADEMCLDVEVIKKKIRSLHITYTGEKRKTNFKKSGSSAEDRYISSLFWYNEMSFLDSSIITRKSMDNSAENNLNSISCEESEDLIYQEHFENSTPKRLESSTPKTDSSNKIDKALEKLLEENESEFVAFGNSVAQQLQKVPVEIGYELMGDIQNTITQRKIKYVLENRTPTVNSSPQASNIMYSSTPTPSNILSLAVTNAELDLDSEYEFETVEF